MNTCTHRKRGRDKNRLKKIEIKKTLHIYIYIYAEVGQNYGNR